MTVRRVVLDDDDPQGSYSEGDPDYDPSEGLSEDWEAEREEWEDDQRKRDEAFGRVYADAHGVGGEERDRDLDAAAPVLVEPTKGNYRLTADQHRANAPYASIARSPDERPSALRDYLAQELGTDGISGQPKDPKAEERARRDESVKWLAGNDPNGAHDWLSTDNPKAERAAIAKDFANALMAHDLTLEQFREALPTGRVGRPSAEQTKLREAARQALRGPWQRAESRTVLADIIGRDRRTLYDLMD